MLEGGAAPETSNEGKARSSTGKPMAEKTSRLFILKILSWLVQRVLRAAMDQVSDAFVR